MISFWRPLTALLCLYAVQTTEADTEGLSPICLLKFGELGGYIKFFPDITPIKDVLTVCAWIKKAQTGADMSWIFYKYGDILEYKVTVSDSGDSNYINIDYIEGQYLGVTSTVAIPLNTWVHQCQSWSLASSTVKTYSNGRLIESKSGTPPYPLNEGGYVLIGSNSETERFHGEMMKLNVFGKELSGTEIAELYAGGRCSDVERTQDAVRFISWESVLSQDRTGDVTDSEQCTGMFPLSHSLITVVGIVHWLKC